MSPSLLFFVVLDFPIIVVVVFSFFCIGAIILLSDGRDGSSGIRRISSPIRSDNTI